MTSGTEARVSKSVLSASKEALCSSLALLSELSLFNLLFQKSADWLTSGWNLVTEQKWSSESNHFANRLKAKAEQYAPLSGGECLLRVLGELEKLMEVKPRDLRTRYDLAEIAEDLCETSVRMLQGDKAAKFKGSTPPDLMDYQMGKVFAGLKIAVGNLSDSQQGQVFEAIRDFIAKMPADQREFILKQLGASELTEAVIRTAMLNGTLWTAFAVAVQVFGFAFYMMAAQFLAIISFHLLPFGAYIGLSSLIAVLSSPWMLPIFLVFGGWLYSRQNTDLRKSAVPMLLLTLWISGMEIENRQSGNAANAIEEALHLWADARNRRDQDRQLAEDAKTRRDKAESALDQTLSELKSAKYRKDLAETRIEELAKLLSKEILDAVRAISQGAWGYPDQAAATRIIEVEDRIAQAQSTRDSVQEWWDRAWEEVKYWTGDCLKFNSELEEARKQLVSQISSRSMANTESYPSQVALIFRRIEGERSRVIEARLVIEKLENVKTRQEGELDQARRAFARADSARRQSEKRYYGLEMV